ncbi:MAG TPA: GAF domain-containing protein [Candidatus Acidoferrales bacterium]|jgi:hypothetical protein|nr:GAF domain-containing protein [Candidatus Acidoferrales bacterium]
MAPGPTRTALQKLLEDHQSRLSFEVETLFAESREGAQREFGDQLNQAVRRLRMASDADELSATLLDAAAQFSGGSALFRVAGEAAKLTRVRVMPESAAEALGLEISLPSAAALAGAVESRDPVTAVSTPAEVSSQLCKLFGHPADGRVSIYPVVVRDRVPALIYAWGTVEGSAIELLTQVAAAVWSAIPEPVTVSELIAISPAATVPAPAPAMTWENLSVEDQQIHLRAQRFARVQVAEMRLFEADAVQTGRTRHNLYEALRKSIDAARQTFRNQFFVSCPNMVDYLDLEFTRTLANDDPDLLGKTYPGPLVR